MKDSRAYTVSNPILHDGSDGREPVWRRQEVFTKIDVAGCKSDGWINKASCIAAKATTRMHERDHFAERSHDKAYYTVDHSVEYEGAGRISLNLCRTISLYS